MTRSRSVNRTDLHRQLCDIDVRYSVRCENNEEFSTALDMTLELESSFKCFIDARNELYFLRKIQGQQCIPFSYNQINITNLSGLNKRKAFLENETAYRCKRMDKLFRQLQCVVVPSIVDDITSVHGALYAISWSNANRYWFNKYKSIKKLNYSPIINGRVHKHQHRSHNSIHATKNVNIKSKVIVPRASTFNAESEVRYNEQIRSTIETLLKMLTELRPETNIINVKK